MPRASLLFTVALCLLPLALRSPFARSSPDAQIGQAPIALTPGLVIDHSVRVRPGTYRLPSARLDAPALTIRGEDVTVDLTGVTIEGGDPFADPDGYLGTGILIEGGRGVTIRGAAIRGYKVGLLARRSPGLHLTGNDLSYNWKARLQSGIERESLADWMSYHDNERDQWLRYGAAIYLSECDDAEIDHNRAVQGENGLMVTRSARLTIWNNTFSWLSAVGLGLYRTTDSSVMHNRLDWDVRGYSHGFYNRGQDSTGILMYEQSSRNVVAYNSVTHGGDGVFIWAGQSTMDTGQGGVNDNLFALNDFSHAVANGIEATFSRNTFVRNRVDECWHGVWGGYSYDTRFVDNAFAGNTEAIAIEHGQNITIIGNTFKGDETAVRLWANATQDPNWGYPKFRDTRSRDYVIALNTFERHRTAFNILRTSGVRIENNTYASVTTLLQTGVEVGGLVFEPPGAAAEGRPRDVAARRIALPPPRPGGMNAMLPAGARRGRATIIVDEWGPYDYRSPKVWPAGRLADRPLTLRVLGPEGRWSLKSIHGAEPSARSGAVPGEIALTPSGLGADLALELEYVGGEVVTPRGQVIPAGQPSRMSYALFDPAIDWTVRFWKFDAASDPLARLSAFEAKLATPPARTERLARLDYASARAFGDGFADHLGLVADGVVDLPAGSYELSVSSDDGVKVWLDDRLVIEDWSIHGSTEDRAPMTGGRHRVRIEYFQNTGAAALQVQVRRK
jgi:nitrous oxidase accessory protein NosD